MTTLKPCPFCGKPAYSYYPIGSDGRYESVTCENIDCHGSMDGSEDFDAIAAWNRRATQAAQSANPTPRASNSVFGYWVAVCPFCASRNIERIDGQEGQVKTWQCLDCRDGITPVSQSLNPDPAPETPTPAAHPQEPIPAGSEAPHRKSPQSAGRPSGGLSQGQSESRDAL